MKNQTNSGLSTTADTPSLTATAANCVRTFLLQNRVTHPHPPWPSGQAGGASFDSRPSHAGDVSSGVLEGTLPAAWRYAVSARAGGNSKLCM